MMAKLRTGGNPHGASIRQVPPGLKKHFRLWMNFLEPLLRFASFHSKTATDPGIGRPAPCSDRNL
jgi:hypothetical protein